MEGTEALRVAPSARELERAIASVPGVDAAAVHRDPVSGRSRLRLRLAPGEDAQRVSWSVSATLRERFGIAVDPDAIHPLVEAAAADPAADTIRLVDADDHHDPSAEHPVEHLPETPPTKPELFATRTRLTAAASAALDAVHHLVPDTATSPERPPSRHVVDLLASGLLAPVVDGAAHDEPEAEARDLPAFEAGVSPAEAVPVGGPAANGTPTVDVAAAPAATSAAPTAQGVVPGQVASGTAGRAEAVDPAATLGRAPGVRTTPPAPRMPDGGGGGMVRVAIRHLDTQRDAVDVRVTATLQLDGRAAHGQAVSVPTRAGTLRAVAEATLAALRELTGSWLLAGIDRITLHPVSEPAMVTVVVSIVTDRGEETLLGGSIVRGDPDLAVMRATLDALNRRVVFEAPVTDAPVTDAVPT